MKHYQPARAHIDQRPLSAADVYKTMRTLFPGKNDFGPRPDQELVEEMATLGITTARQFRLLMKRWRRCLRLEDRAPLYDWEVEFFSEWFGQAHVADALRRQYWFAYPALIRNALELEFGEAAIRLHELLEDDEAEQSQ